MSLQKSKNAYKKQSELEIQEAKNSVLEGNVFLLFASSLFPIPHTALHRRAAMTRINIDLESEALARHVGFQMQLDTMSTVQDTMSRKVYWSRSKKFVCAWKM
jgi:hypothetical protein